MRRRLARRGQLVRARSRAKNQIHAVLMRQLVGRPPVSDLFGVKGRKWLAGLELAFEERETVDAAMRQIEFLDTEIAAVERLIARDALDSEQIRRLMSVPGRERDRRRELPGRDRRHRPLREPAQARRLPGVRSARAPVRAGPGDPRL